MSILVEIGEALEKGKRKLVVQYVQQALDEGFAPQTILTEGLLPGMDRVGVKFRDNEIFVPEVLVAARAMGAGTELLKPLLAEGEGSSLGTAVIGTVKGDLHDIGKNLVKMMIEGKGINVVDLGVDAKLICCSSLLTTTMPAMGDVVKAAEAAGIRGNVKIMVGGAPVTQEFAESIGADCYTADAASAAMAAAEYLKA